MISTAIDFSDRFRKDVLEIKNVSPKYPNVYEHVNDRQIVISTMVEFTYNGVIYERHCLESAIIYPGSSPQLLLEKSKKRLIGMAELVKSKAVPCEYDDVVRVLPIEND